MRLCEKHLLLGEMLLFLLFILGNCRWDYMEIMLVWRHFLLVTIFSCFECGNGSESMLNNSFDFTFVHFQYIYL